MIPRNGGSLDPLDPLEPLPPLEPGLLALGQPGPRVRGLALPYTLPSR